MTPTIYVCAQTFVRACVWTLLLTLTLQPLSLIAAQDDANVERPNIIFIVTDDQIADTIDYMPILQAELVAKGTTFTNAYVTSPVCCPARASILRGQYLHNHKVMTNQRISGGFDKFLALGLEKSTVATWVQAAGYRTGLIGKYLNHYPAKENPTHVPPGWDAWYAWWYKNDKSDFNRYTRFFLNENGKTVKYGIDEPAYMTDVLNEKAVGFVEDAIADKQPFLLYLATIAPHGPAVPAPRHENLFNDTPLPTPPSFNEADVSDKPRYVRKKALLTAYQIEELTTRYRNQLRTLQGVDEMIGALIDTLDANGQLDNTYIVFTTDNGVHFGTHRLITKKGTAYTEDVRIPLIVRGPGVPAGGSISRMVSMADFAPTIAQLATAKTPRFVDGRSLLPLWTAADPDALAWRDSLLISYVCAYPLAIIDTYASNPKCFNQVRTETYAYVHYPVHDEYELYDVVTDPYQIYNLLSKRSGTEETSVDLKIIAQAYDKALKDLLTCRGASCRLRENLTLP